MRILVKDKIKLINFSGFLIGVIMLIYNRGIVSVSDITWNWISSGEIVALLLFATAYLWKIALEHEKITTLGRLLQLIPVIPGLFSVVLLLLGVLRVDTFLWLCELYLVVIVIFKIARFALACASNTERPANVMLVSFIGLILAGAGLLMLPGMHRSDISFTDAVFTATSAVCVTGLAVCDTAGDCTSSGQYIILALIQIGGLGIMIFGALFAMLLGSRLSMKESVAMRDILNEQNFGNISRTVIFICISTFAIELVAMCFLFSMPGAGNDFQSKVFFSLFHSVSAFCNAGFALQSDSLEAFRNYWQVYLVICPLIVLGGLGFPVLRNIFDIARFRFNRLYTYDSDTAPPRLSLHSRLVLVTTFILLIGGTLLLWAGGLANNCANDHKLSLLDCFFNSVTARTAGFNTVNISDLNAANKLILIGLMCLGGSPASTAGGIKTIAVAVMFLTIISTIRNQTTVNVHFRSVSVAIVRRSLVLVAVYISLLWLVTLILIITENSMGTDVLDLAFESASALGTVGLTTGLTPELSVQGRWVIISSMFIGRLGPLSLLTALTVRPRLARYDYPPEPLVIG